MQNRNATDEAAVAPKAKATGNHTDVANGLDTNHSPVSDTATQRSRTPPSPPVTSDEFSPVTPPHTPTTQELDAHDARMAHQRSEFSPVTPVPIDAADDTVNVPDSWLRQWDTSLVILPDHLKNVSVSPEHPDPDLHLRHLRYVHHQPHLSRRPVT
jgi:hypothetical protein